MKRLICAVIGHKYTNVRRLSDQSHLLACRRCLRLFAINTSVRVLIPWDSEVADFYRTAFGVELSREDFKPAGASPGAET